MEFDPRSSTGSTVSGSYNTVFNAKNPIGYIYISHPFGTLGNSQKQYNINNNIKILEFQSPITSQETEMSFKRDEYSSGVRPNNISYQNTVKDRKIKENAGNKIIFEDYLSPEFKYIIDSIRKAWNSSNLSLKYETLKDKIEPRQYFQNYSQENRTLADLILQRPKQLIRRYSVPETAIRKYNFIYEHSCTQFDLPIKSKKPFSQANQRYNKNVNYLNQMKNIFTSVSNANMPDNNYETTIVKPFTMPEVKRKKDCFYCSSKKNNLIEKTIIQNSIKNRNKSDIFISDLLIRNLNEDMAIAEILINNINNDDYKSEKTLTNLKEKSQISSIYISPDRLNCIVNSNKDIKTYQSYKDINIKSDESLEFNRFVKANINHRFPNSNEKNSDNNSKDKLNKNSINEHPPIIMKRPESTVISSSFSLTNSSDGLSTSEMQLLPIETNKIYDNEMNFFHQHIKFPNLKNDNVLLNKREKMKLATIQTNLKHQIIDSGIKNNDNNFKIPIIEELIKTPYINQNSSIKQRPVSKSILNSIEACTFDSMGNINFRVLSAAISKEEQCPNQSAYTAKYNQKTNPNNVRKITIFEAQSNMVTPDNDNGPRRFYQKTEILNGDKKIDILEIVECMQNSIDCKPKSEFNTKVSKIPIPIDNLKLIKKKKNCYEKNIIEPRLSKIEINRKGNDDKKYQENNHAIWTYEQHSMPKCFYPLENVTPKINSKIQAVKPLCSITNNRINEVTPPKRYNFTREHQRDKYSTGAYLTTTTDDSLRNTITPSSGTAIHGSASRNKKISDELSSKIESFRLNKVPSLMTTTKLHTTSNLNVRNSLENTKLETQYDLENSNDYIPHNKLNAWRIPSSNLYGKNKTNMGTHMESIPRIHQIPKTSNTESSIKCKTICNRNCQFCSCCSTFTGNSGILYSPTQSVCSLCSKVYNSTRLPTCNTECTMPENKISIDPLHNCKDKNVLHCNKNCKIFPPISTNSVCECRVENSNISYVCNPEKRSRLCQYSKCSKIDDFTFPEGILSNSRLDFSAEGFVTPSSSIAESHWKSHNELLSCNYNQRKTFNLASEKNHCTQNNTNPVWTVTVTTKCLQQAADLKMEFKFPQPPAELSIENDFSENEENENCSLGCVNSAPKTINPKNSDKSSSSNDRNIEECYNDFGGYSLNFTSLLTKRNCGNSKQDCKNLSVMGNAIAPEQKPRVQTMSERDLTRRRYHKTCNNFTMRNNL